MTTNSTKPPDNSKWDDEGHAFVFEMSLLILGSGVFGLLTGFLVPLAMRVSTALELLKKTEATVSHNLAQTPYPQGCPLPRKMSFIEIPTVALKGKKTTTKIKFWRNTSIPATPVAPKCVKASTPVEPRSEEPSTWSVVEAAADEPPIFPLIANDTSWQLFTDPPEVTEPPLECELKFTSKGPLVLRSHLVDPLNFFDALDDVENTTPFEKITFDDDRFEQYEIGDDVDVFEVLPPGEQLSFSQKEPDFQDAKSKMATTSSNGSSVMTASFQQKSVKRF